MNTGTRMNTTPFPESKEQLVERLFKEGHINFKQALLLMDIHLPITDPYSKPYWYTSPTVFTGNTQ